MNGFMTKRVKIIMIILASIFLLIFLFQPKQYEPYYYESLYNIEELDTKSSDWYAAISRRSNHEFVGILFSDERETLISKKECLDYFSQDDVFECYCYNGNHRVHVCSVLDNKEKPLYMTRLLVLVSVEYDNYYLQKAFLQMDFDENIDFYNQDDLERIAKPLCSNLIKSYEIRKVEIEKMMKS